MHDCPGDITREQGMCKSRTHVCGNSAEDECVGVHVISEGEKQSDDF